MVPTTSDASIEDDHDRMVETRSRKEAATTGASGEIFNLVTPYIFLRKTRNMHKKPIIYEDLI